MSGLLGIISLLAISASGVIGQVQHPFQLSADTTKTSGSQKLHGRFLHITDIHPDHHYIPFSNTDSDHDCHRGKGDAGILGSAGTDCDSPFSLVNATFAWIKENLSDSIDFVVWTGDSARHDNDEHTPRTEAEIISLNQAMVDGLTEAFANKKSGGRHQNIPIIPTLGNNDVMPHNIFEVGPNRWTKTYARMWRKFIPEEQRHSFVQGGWFYVEVIPNKLAVFSLNTMYFFDSNNAVDGCYDKSEPGYEHMEWLRIQLQFMRDRNMKAILIGHVAPARTPSKESWDESCWQKYTLWLKQYRDVIVGSVYGHMNIDHFMLHDFHDLKYGDSEFSQGLVDEDDSSDEFTTQSRSTYLRDLKDLWSKIPSPPSRRSSSLSIDYDKSVFRPTPNKSKKKYLRQIGGKWAERYAVSLVSPSVIPNYFPSLRVIEYNVSGLNDLTLWSPPNLSRNPNASPDESPTSSFDAVWEHDVDSSKKRGRKKRKERKKKKKKPKDRKRPPKFTIPKPPSRTSPPGPAYSNQPFTWLGYTQYFANITKFNPDFQRKPQGPRRLLTWREFQSQKVEKLESSEFANAPFEFEVEYNTTTDKVFKLKDLTVKSYMKLARRIAESPGLKKHELQFDENPISDDEYDLDAKNAGKTSFDESESDVSPSRINLWKIFLRRAFVGYLNDDELRDLIHRG